MSLQVDESAPKHTDEAPSSGRHASPMSFGFLVFFIVEAGQMLDRRRTEQEAGGWRSQQEETHP